eukprot:CAMPEP_0194759580 /NCGR_PEP_ID=MMETSP0323_2-20130528/12612_1 /TAXON_ID=2866 ORGANISM="Crypthecodinium cohnii, Strain Seligo" /NCGR_SAMPLE_ID=MMETSP0323_2 /ASSEMBLY_ACC=CAM_ASM_000346 /LENGTH=73 /DNA_ID=CAMNT_0039680385 /DNA_START=96 /DNA_END=317 /DNA_ORIENTATION=-
MASTEKLTNVTLLGDVFVCKTSWVRVSQALFSGFDVFIDLRQTKQGTNLGLWHATDVRRSREATAKLREEARG